MNTHSCQTVAMIVLFIATAVHLQEQNVQEREAPINADWKEMMASMERMHAAVISMQPSKNSDVDFVRTMLPHHQAAIDMAKTELKYGKDPQIRRLAQEIVTDQQSEIELMQLWLKEHGPHK